MYIKSLSEISSLKIVLLLILILLGLSTKLYGGLGSAFIYNHLGGIIYVIFWILFFSVIFPEFSYYKLVILVFLIICAIEFTQLVKNPNMARVCDLCHQIIKT
jgi:hypothetical protein